MAFKSTRKLFYLHKRKKNNSITEKEKAEYNSMLIYFNIKEEKELDEYIEMFGYSKQAAEILLFDRSIKEPKHRKAFIIILILIIIIFFSKNYFKKFEKE